jgi:hypothetical protein
MRWTDPLLGVSIMQGTWKEGDRGANSCPRCRKLVRTRFELRTVELLRTRLRVPQVLVDVCDECDHMISFPRQSIPQLLAAGAIQ